MKRIVRCSLFLLPAFIAGFLAATPASAIPVIQNGSFEDPAYGDDAIHSFAATGWIPAFHAPVVVVSGNIVDNNGDSYGVTPFGTQYAGMDKGSRTGGVSRISQDVVGFEAGQAYELTLYVADSDGGTSPTLEINFYDSSDNDIVYLDQTYNVPFGGPYTDTIQFNKVVIPFTAPVSGDILLSLTNSSYILGPPASISIDNVSIAAAPEPTTFGVTLLGAGALLSGLLLRKRKAHQ